MRGKRRSHSAHWRRNQLCVKEKREEREKKEEGIHIDIDSELTLPTAMNEVPHNKKKAKEQKHNTATTASGQGIVQHYDFTKWRGSDWALRYNSDAANSIWDRVDNTVATIAKE
jgi:hypothetical protein